MNKQLEKVIRKTFHVPEDELLTLWRLPGWRSCPLGDPEMGVTNCPLGFDMGKWSPNTPPAWMRERLSEEVMTQCQYCQGEPQLPLEEAQIWAKSLEMLMGGDKC